MLTWNDCIDLTDLTPEEVEAIAQHEHLTAMAALTKGAHLLHQAWGEPALRQMAWDNLRHAVGQHGQRTRQLEAVFFDTCAHHPGGSDRRRLPRIL
ncbi:MAG TPA: hypothetical protein VEB64_03260 [Azospirillaceae bacterium]|nr:hypothetical protein [Azospirillaceae bacterium]